MTMQGGRVRGNQLANATTILGQRNERTKGGGGSKEVGSWFEETASGDETK